MCEDIVRTLENYHNGGVISGFVCSMLPDTELRSGWIEQGVKYKMTSPELGEREYHTQFLIPGDRVARLAHEFDAIDVGSALLFIIGNQGASREKMVAVVSSIDSESFLIVWKTSQQSIQDIAAFVMSEVLHHKGAIGQLEDNIDYIENMREDLADGHLNGALSLMLPKNDSSFQKILRKASTLSESDEIPLCRGDIAPLASIMKLFYRWLKQIKIFETYKNGLVSCMVLRPGVVKVILWDNSKSIASIAIQEPVALPVVFSRYIIPFWMTVQDVKSGKVESLDRHTTEPVSAGGTKASDILKLIESKLEPYLSLVKQFDEIKQRIVRIEESVDERGPIDVGDSTARSESSQKNVERALYGLVSRLEQIAERLEKLESELNSIVKENK